MKKRKKQIKTNKKNIVIFFLVIAIVLSILGNIYVNKRANTTIISNFVKENVETPELNEMNIYIYNDSKSEIVQKTIELSDNSIKDIVKSVLQNTNYVNDRVMKLLAVYEFTNNNENDVLIKLNTAFDLLTSDQMNGLKKAISQSILDNVENVSNVYISQ